MLDGDVPAEAEKETSSGYSENNEESYDHILDANVSELEVKRAIPRLRSGKDAGVYGILAEILKAAEH